MPQRTVWKSSAIAVALLGLAACLDREAPLTPGTDPDPAPTTRLEAQVSCVASISEETVACAVPSGGGDQALIIGGQGQYVQLTSSNVQVTGNVFSFDVTVQNLIHQPMGTLDGTTLHPEGVRVFFASGPTTTGGTGDIVVGNPDGTATFLAAGQPYFQYDQILQHQEVSDPREWQLVFDPGVDTFAFTVYVSTEVQFEENWVDLGANTPYFLAGADTPLVAVLRDPVGNAVAGDFSWTSSNPTVVTVDSAGRLQALALGYATITATSGTASGELSVGVCPVMLVGAHAAYNGAAGGQLCLPGGDAGGVEYVLVPVNVSQTAPVEITTFASGIGTVTGPPNPALLPTGIASFTQSFGGVADLHNRGSVRSARAGSLAPGGPSLAIVPGVPAVGALWDLNVEPGCVGGTDTRTGRVTVVGDHTVIVVDTLNPAVSTPDFYQTIADTLDAVVAPVIYSNFNGGTLAEPTDIDANDRVVYFFSTAVTSQLDPAATDEYGYFAERDLESTVDCARSNAGEIIYLAAPDPAGTVGPALATDLVLDHVNRTVAHELQHLVNRSYRNQAGDAAEEAWLDEAMSRVAEEMVFFQMAGLAPEQNVGGGAFGTGNEWRIPLFNRVLRRNFLHLQWWLEAPDTTGAANQNVSLASGGAGWAFLRYYIDRQTTAANNGAALTSLVQSGQTGAANLSSALGGNPAVYLRDFTASLYVDDAVSNLQGLLQNPSWNYRALYGGAGGYPIAPRPLVNDVPHTLTYSEGGGAAYLRFSVPAGEWVDVTNEVAGAAPPADVLFQVVRTR